MACPFDTDGNGDCNRCTRHGWTCSGVGPVPTRPRPDPQPKE